MTPLGVPFIDSAGARGANQAVNAPKSETDLHGKGERSMRKIEQVINCQFKNGGFSIRLDNVIGPRVRVKKVDMVRFANWILSTTVRTK